MSEPPKLLQGVYDFVSRGLETPISLHPNLTYTVPVDKHVRPFYCRADNIGDN